MVVNGREREREKVRSRVWADGNGRQERKIDRFRTRFATLLLSQLINGFCWMLVEAFNARTQPY